MQTRRSVSLLLFLSLVFCPVLAQSPKQPESGKAGEVQPYVVFDRAALVNSGATTVEEFMAKRMNPASPEAVMQRDGKRIEKAGLKEIALAKVERIEVLPGKKSEVVNIVSR